MAEINHAINLSFSLSLSTPSPIFDSVSILSTSVWCSLSRTFRIRFNFTIRWKRKLIKEFPWPRWRLRDVKVKWSFFEGANLPPREYISVFVNIDLPPRHYFLLSREFPLVEKFASFARSKQLWRSLKS